MADVRIPAPLRRYTNGEAVVKIDGKNVKEIIENLEKKYPGIKERLLDETGSLRRFINIFVDKEDIRFKKMLDTEVSETSDISIVPAIAGGIKLPLELIFPEELVKEPVIYRLSKQFNIVFNIRRARVTEKYGELVVEFEGDEKTVDEAIAWLKKQNIKVNPVIKNASA